MGIFFCMRQLGCLQSKWLTTILEITDVSQRRMFPPFLVCLTTLSIFLNYTNDSTLTLLKNSLFNTKITKYFFIVIKSTYNGGMR